MAAKPEKPRHPYRWLVLNVAACACWLAYPAVRRSMSPDLCLRNLRVEAGAIAMYALDSDRRLPVAGIWMDSTLPYTGDPAYYRCPDLDRASRSEFGHAYAASLSGSATYTSDTLSRTPAVFDSRNHIWNATGTLDLLPREPRDGRGYGVAYLDGHGAVRLDRDALR